MKKMLLLFALLLAAVPCYAGIPPLPFDGNGNMYPVMWDGTNWVFVSDSAAIGSAFGSTDSMPVKGSIYVITSSGAPLYVREVNNDTTIGGVVVTSDTPYTTTNISYDTELTGTTFDTFTLDREYDMIYVSSDTDVIVALTYSEAVANTGDMQYAGITTPYNYRTRYVWLRTKSGLALSEGRVSVRGML